MTLTPKKCKKLLRKDHQAPRFAEGCQKMQKDAEIMHFFHQKKTNGKETERNPQY